MSSSVLNGFAMIAPRIWNYIRRKTPPVDPAGLRRLRGTSP